jgi:protein-S-isoprenylcysteine O-methyltransferase Ste14
MLALLARWRVSLGFLCAAAAFALARPSLESWRVGLIIAAVGEGVRLWAAGHIEKGREITRSGPYRYVRHPLYLGSALLALGYLVAARSMPAAVMGAIYLGVTVSAAIRTEEAALDRVFAGQYTAYRTGQAQPVARRFSWRRVAANREYRAVLGTAAAFLWLWVRMQRS